jgi:hypothetical protein
MRRVLLLVMMMMMAGFGVAVAQEDVTSPLEMAQYTPADALVFTAVRIDEAYLEDLDGVYQLLAPVTNGMMGVPSDLVTALDQSLASSDLTTAELLAAFGDYASLSVLASDPMTGETDARLLVAVDDQAAVESILEKLDLSEDGTEGAYTLYSVPTDSTAVMALSADWLVLYPSIYDSVPDTAPADPLSASATFEQAVDALPAESYNMVGYLQSGGIPPGQFGTDAVNVQQVAGVGFGLTILPTNILTFDYVQVPGADQEIQVGQAVNPEFLRFLPSDTSMFIQGHDPSSFYTSLMEQLGDVAQRNNTADPAQQVNAAFSSIGINIKTDILAWTRGDYAVFAGFEDDVLLDLINGNITTLWDRTVLGIVAETSDPALSAAFARKLGEVLRDADDNNAVILSEESLFDTDVVVASITSIGGETVEVLIGSTDEVFFLGSRLAVMGILAQDGSVSGNADYQAMQALLLPNPTSVWFMDREGAVLTATSLFGVTLISFAFSGSTDLDSITGLQEQMSVFGPMTISSAMQDDGVIVVRSTMQMGPAN